LPGVVDLATSPARNQWLDIWCTMRSEFLIGCDSGPSWLAMLLDVPILTVNAVHFRDLSRPADRITCKLARDTTTGETLSVSEMLTDEFLRVGFKGDRYDCVDNSPADLRRAVLDMIEVVHGRERRSSWQNRFNRLLHAAERQGLGGRSALDGVVINGRARGTLSHGFAKKHFVRERTPRVEQTPRTLGGCRLLPLGVPREVAVAEPVRVAFLDMAAGGGQVSTPKRRLNRALGCRLGIFRDSRV